MPHIKRIDHVAVVVDDIDKALAFWSQALGLDLEHIEEVPEQASRIAFLPTGESEVELVEPTTDDSGLARYLQKRGPGMHHMCFEVDDIDEMLARLKERDIRLVNESALSHPDGKRYAFIHPESTGGVLVELYELTTDE